MREGSRTPNRSFGNQIGKAPGSVGRNQKTPGKGLSTSTASRKTSGAKRNITPSRNPHFNKTPGKTAGDRYCPNRSSSMQDLAKYELGRSQNSSNSLSAPTSPSKAEAARAMSELLNGGVTAPPNADVSMAGQGSSNFKILSFQTGKAPAPPLGHTNGNTVLYTTSRTASGASSCRKTSRHIPTAPDRVLDAPYLCNDFYLNLIDWSSSDALAVALGNCAYVWHAGSGEIDKLVELDSEEEYVSSVAWSEDGAYLAVGLSTGDTGIYDVANRRRLRLLKGTEGRRVGSLAWNNSVLTTGSEHGVINHFDVTKGQPLMRSLTEAHRQEVCGLKWSPGGRYLASGGNDNQLRIWTPESEQRYTTNTPLHTLTLHQAAVKTSLLASGGGTADRHIRIWNVNSGACLQSVDAESQTSLLASGGGTADRHIRIWNVNSGACLQSVDAESQTSLLASGGGTADRHIRIWNVNSGACLQSVDAESQTSLLASGGGTADRHIRIWNVNSGACLQSVDAESQTSLLASGGGTADRHIRIWNVNSGACLQSVDAESQTSLLASGGGTADRHIRIWNVNSGACLQSVDAESQTSLLASGGGTADRHIRIWNVNSGACLQSVDAESQTSLLASGGGTADRHIRIWNVNSGACLQSVDAESQTSLLASGGGTADRHIRIWNVNSGACLQSVDAESQVSSLLWNSDYKELMSSHGYPSYQLTIWKYPALTKVGELGGHTERVLGLAMSPDGQRVVSAGADESLRIWAAFAKDPAMAKKPTGPKVSLRPGTTRLGLIR